MNLSLRARLLFSYALLLAVMLVVIGAALLLFLFAQPIPPEPTYQRLASIARDYIAGVQTTNGRLPNLVTLITGLDDFAKANEVRSLIVNIANRTVVYDSSGDYQRGDALPFSLETYTLPAYLRRGLPARLEPIFGGFNDKSHVQWLFTGLAVTRQGSEMGAIVLADRRPTQTLNGVLATFGGQLALPLAGAMAGGLIVALLLAALISRNLARPLQTLVNAAEAVAEGHYDQHVPVVGPPEIRAVAEAFNQMSAQVHDTQQSQQDFLANVSHDLKTPLTSIQGYSQAVMDGAAKDAQHAASIIYEEAGRLNRMVVQLTDLARLQAGRLSMQTTPIDMGKLTAAVGQRLSIVAQEKGITLNIESDSMPEIAGDGDRLVQVLTNLVSNALKYTPSGGTIWVKTQVNHNGVEVIVRDTGIGIPVADLPRIFERFYQVDKARGPRRGTGLGLAITQEIVQAHGGKITVTSPGEKQGSTFTVWLPSPILSTIARKK
jgi:signal transduction histidine kinase